MIAPVLPRKHPPIRANGSDNQDVYLVEDTAGYVHGHTRAAWGELQRIQKRLLSRRMIS